MSNEVVVNRNSILQSVANWAGICGMSDANKEKVKAIADALADLVQKVGSTVKDGVSFEDLKVIPELIPPVMSLVENIPGLTGADKKQLAVEIIWIIYKAIDTWPDGTGNRIRIPEFLMNITGKTEEELEYTLVRSSASLLIELGHKYLFAKKDNC